MHREGSTAKATRPTRGKLVLTHQVEREAASFQTFLPPPAENKSALRTACLLAGRVGGTLGVRQPSPPVCRLSGASPLAHSRPQLSQ